MVAVPRPMLCELMSSFDIPEEGREDAGEGHASGGGGEFGGRGGCRIGSPLCLSHVSAQLNAQTEPCTSSCHTFPHYSDKVQLAE